MDSIQILSEGVIKVEDVKQEPEDDDEEEPYNFMIVEGIRGRRVHVTHTCFTVLMAKILQVGVKSVETSINNHKKEEALTTPKKTHPFTDIDNFTKD